MCDKIWSTLQVQCFSLALLIIYIITGVYWFLAERSTNILCKKEECFKTLMMQNSTANIICKKEEHCKTLMDTTLLTFLSLNIPGCFVLAISATQQYIHLLVGWLAVVVFQIPIAYFGSLWFLFWHRLMDPTPALICAGLLLLYGCLLLASWVSAYDLFYTIRLSREQHRVTALVVVLYEI